ncbi:NUMOD4 domain-containing protein [Staphylococcus haemolyticus]|uniref:NUMOD4 domain-containing protein n=1 Tax=Staphylococcus haemolyticus TaxID=1283 RepID=UPI0029008113|nr:NUMOD4 domain-containing protein [Staphylococcus haemolyticus]MDU0441564.1 NUMOD4 domain-containing protein [Staphylococcus haemolyticus]MDU0443772.1 NUMOD4 domain-containing protein [Staphylococcus haemolyticus]MDU0473682.1 NUMOD4 domain-containing protein [Staphylococcus haemolyticus]
MKEVWKDVPKFEGYYQVSNLGNIRSVERVVKYRDGRKYNYPSKLLKQRKDTNGYLQVSFNVNGNKSSHRTHRLVAETFLIKPEIDLISVNHIDGVKINNKLDNLEWVTYSENTKKGYDAGLFEKARKAARERWKNNTYQCKKVEVVFKDTGTAKKFKSAREASRYINRCQNYFTQLLRIGGENKYYKVKFID